LAKNQLADKNIAYVHV